jgi:beta-glucosidase/6-phospho-beta-glucosidase/beta-galactosidase
MQYYLPSLRRNPTTHPFLFATGIENSYPVITDRNGRRKRVDELEKTGFYERWREDFRLVRDLEVQFLRYGPPYYRVHQGPDRYDWSFADETLAELRRLEIVPIVDLCHFGLPDWAGFYQNTDWPELFAQYASAFAKRFPWVRFYTPVNEIFITARFSARIGWWNEQLCSDQAFVTALKNAVRANLLAEEAILNIQPRALFIQSESTEYFHAKEPAALARAVEFNEERFLSLDLCYGNDVRGSAYQYLTDNGLSREEYVWFMQHGSNIKPYCVMGNDYYQTNEHTVPAGDAPLEPSGEIFGYYIITHQYFQRYHLPVMHTETNIQDEKRAPAWLWKEWSQMLRLKQDGVPIIGFTWYSLIDQVDWDTALREDNGNVNPLGLYDLDRKIRPVGEMYQTLVEQWRDILPLESLGVDLGLVDEGESALHRQHGEVVSTPV